MLENDNPISLENLSLSNNFKTNVPVGSKIKLVNSNTEYIFYGYNHNQTLISCFPINSSNAFDNMIYVSIEQVETIL